MSGEAIAPDGEAVAPSASDNQATVPGGPAIALARSAAEPAGWFGKLPMLGDFASRRLPPAFVSTCDTWLSLSITASREQLGALWLDSYLTAPVWRFAWAPGVIDASWWFGVLMPSVDAVGRYYPLLIAAAQPTPPASVVALGRLDAWYRHVTAAALDTLQDGATLGALESALVPLPAWPGPDAADAPSLAALPGRQRGHLAGESSTQRWAAVLALAAALERCAGHTLWWPVRTAPDADTLSVSAGLPAPEHFAMLLDGSW